MPVACTKLTVSFMKSFKSGGKYIFSYHIFHRLSVIPSLLPDTSQMWPPLPPSLPPLPTPSPPYFLPPYFPPSIHWPAWLELGQTIKSPNTNKYVAPADVGRGSCKIWTFSKNKKVNIKLTLLVMLKYKHLLVFNIFFLYNGLLLSTGLDLMGHKQLRKNKPAAQAAGADPPPMKLHQ